MCIRWLMCHMLSNSCIAHWMTHAPYIEWLVHQHWVTCASYIKWLVHCTLSDSCIKWFVHCASGDSRIEQLMHHVWSTRASYIKQLVYYASSNPCIAHRVKQEEAKAKTLNMSIWISVFPRDLRFWLWLYIELDCCPGHSGVL